MHALRHTYATRAIEGGMQPKVLQKLLDHASIKTTMDRYVHVTDDSVANAVRQFDSAYAVIGCEKGVAKITRKAETLVNQGFLSRYKYK